jgi:hypothetical protein
MSPKARDDDLFRLIAVVRRDKFETILALIKGETEDLHFSQVNAERAKKWGIESLFDRQPHHRKTLHPERKPEPWELKYWPLLKPVFESLKGGEIFVRDRRLTDALKAAGPITAHYVKNISPLITACVRAGHIIRTRRGYYKLA